MTAQPPDSGQIPNDEDRSIHGELPARQTRVVVAITGASGIVYGTRILERLRDLPKVESHLIVSKSARSTMLLEGPTSYAAVRDLADVVHSEMDLGASISSGSFRTDGMIIAPCSIKTLSGVANAYDDNLVVRAADVTLKERRRLVLMVRETPLTAIHLRLMTQVTHAGAIVFPPVPAFYSLPESVTDLVDHTVARVLDLFDLAKGDEHRWNGDERRPFSPSSE